MKKFIQENPPPLKRSQGSKNLKLALSKKPKPPELPLLLPGMIAIVKNPNNPFYMYCKIVQRITDGKAGVLLEGGKHANRRRRKNKKDLPTGYIHCTIFFFTWEFYFILFG